MQRRPGLQRQPGGASRHPRPLAEQVHLHALLGEVAIGEQRHETAVPQRAQQGAEHRPAGPGERQHPHAQPLAEAHEPVEQLLRTQPLGDRRDRGEPQRGPGAGVVPVAEVTEEHDDAAAVRERGAHRGVALGPLTGQLLAERIVTGVTPPELVPFDPLR